MKKILVIQGHPDSQSFNQALFDRYCQQLPQGYKTINISSLSFDINLEFGYRKRKELEPDLLASLEKIRWADHIVLFFPLWWGSMPAKLKGFFDRLFLPSIAFQKHEKGFGWDKLFQKKSARIFVTMDQPPIFHRLFYRRPVYHAVKRMTFQFTGINPVKFHGIGTVRNSTSAKRQKWLSKAGKLALRDCR